ncbi:DUF7000 family protein [Winogradskyella immobilis]|uniref:DUF7000 domain-containing protein n=1 Tax=Winogradskyella immobilis TaxID=2816852 RepID=A0ABS8EKC0_9FLAO|nr:hypothetical protein [Winogradskyella immobilis]MCC1483646.1 hypothetical protein [Winogradskyella immobilis]MCG0015740.1 hypothetical protein [Winogradskyella immobilis]
MKNLNYYVAVYKEQLDKGDILIAYNQLVNFVMKLRVNFIKSLSDQYSFTGILHGYMDYTYFYYSNAFLKSKKLKLGLVLNHSEMRFEIWLLGNTITNQKKYWNLLKTSKWNKDKKEMPKYSVLEAILMNEPDFDNLPLLSQNIEKALIKSSDEIIKAIKTLN